MAAPAQRTTSSQLPKTSFTRTYAPAYNTAPRAPIAAATVKVLTPLQDVPTSSMISHAFPADTHPDSGSLEFAGATNFIRTMTPASASESAARALPRSLVRDIHNDIQTTGTLASTGAFASIMNGVPINQSCPTSICLDPPPKGITLRAYGQYLKETQGADWNNGWNTNYKSTTKMFGAGFLKDWSVATTLGASIDYLNAEIKSGWADDTRKNKVDGYIFNGHIKSSIMDKFPVDGRLFYGILNTDGSGTTSNGDPWSESKHRSKMYGFSGKIGVPLVFGDDIKLAPDAGLQFIRLRSDAYGATAGGTAVAVGRGDSKSLTVPLTLEVKKEMTQCFGTFTPRMSLGFIREFSDSAMGVRAYNASAANRYAGGVLSGFDDSQKKFYKFGMGMDLNTVGGWAVRADYDYHWADKYKSHGLTLEASKCF